MKILVVDDDDAIRALVTRLFARRGDVVQSAADGAEAIVIVDSDDFDLLILDLMMPRTDGMGVLAHLRTRAARSPVIIVMTAAVPALAAAVPRDQVAAVVTKPFNIRSLLGIADDAVQSSLRAGAT